MGAPSFQGGHAGLKRSANHILMELDQLSRPHWIDKMGEAASA